MGIKSLLMVGLLFGMCASMRAQTEASMCVYVTDVCCDNDWSTVEFTIPSGEQVTKTYIHYGGDEDNKVVLECWDIVGGAEWFRFWTLDDLCGCGNETTVENHAIGQNHILRFKVKCKECEGSCESGSSTVYFSTATAAVCAPNCNPE